jgi:hypothetical protein
MSEFADYVHDQRNMGGFDLAPIQWVGGNGTYGYIIEVYLQAILLLKDEKKRDSSHLFTQPVRLPWETESIQVYYTVENAERCPTFSVSEEDVHHCFDWSHGMITRSPWTPFASVRNA